jgi:hypothetical protein
MVDATYLCSANARASRSFPGRLVRLFIFAQASMVPHYARVLAIIDDVVSLLSGWARSCSCDVARAIEL